MMYLPNLKGARGGCMYSVYMYNVCIQNLRSFYNYHFKVTLLIAQPHPHFCLYLACALGCQLAESFN